jgi:Ubiquitin-specific protease C-terminal
MAETMERLQARLGMDDKDFAKVRLALVPQTIFGEMRYLEERKPLDFSFSIDSTILLTPFQDEILGNISFTDETLLGLDHVDKTRKLGRSEGNLEKPILIR